LKGTDPPPLRSGGTFERGGILSPWEISRKDDPHTSSSLKALQSLNGAPFRRALSGGQSFFAASYFILK